MFLIINSLIIRSVVLSYGLFFIARFNFLYYVNFALIYFSFVLFLYFSFIFFLFCVVYLFLLDGSHCLLLREAVLYPDMF